ncbi:MAG: hypothetical protein NC915_04285 [Candidatus Omnitrophica bacterium]|nr:hypothetical protein [Candidatus Omnitrophota bacterium]
MSKNNNQGPLICPNCGSFYFKCFSCGYVFCRCESTEDICPECESLNIGLADIDDIEDVEIFYEKKDVYEELFEDIDEDENIN